MGQRAPRRIVDGVSEKLCTGTCQAWLAETTANFYGRPDGALYSQCKVCWGTYIAKRGKTGATAPARQATEPPSAPAVVECTAEEFAAFVERCRLVSAFDAYHALDLLTCDWGKTKATSSAPEA
jgi:hypothetical protein